MAQLKALAAIRAQPKQDQDWGGGGVELTRGGLIGSSNDLSELTSDHIAASNYMTVNTAPSRGQTMSYSASSLGNKQ